VVVGPPTLNRKQGLTPRSFRACPREAFGLDPAKPSQGLTPRSLRGIGHVEDGDDTIRGTGVNKTIPVPLIRSAEPQLTPEPAPVAPPLQISGADPWPTASTTTTTARRITPTEPPRVGRSTRPTPHSVVVVTRLLDQTLPPAEL